MLTSSGLATIEKFTMYSRSRVACGVAQLITTELFKDRLDADDFMRRNDDLIGYGLLNGAGDVLGGAAVSHHVEIEFGSFITDLRTIAINASFRGQGLGKSLMRRIAREAVNNQDERIELLALDESVGFYTRLGFTPTSYGFGDEEDLLVITPTELLINLSARSN